MDAYTLAAIILTVAVLIGYINHRYIKMQSTIAIMTGSLLLSLVLLILQHLGFAHFETQIQHLVLATDFHSLLLNGMLSFLLFAGAMTIDFSTFKSQKWEIGTLASISTIVSTLIIGSFFYYLLPLLHLQLPFIYCLLFGALISPTDPIAVIATLKEIKAPKQLEVCVAGESLFNDGVGIVIFVTLYQLAFKGTPITVSHVTLLFLQQAIGGLVYGLILGWITYKLITTVNDHKMAILITLMTVTGGYSLALHLNISGALAMVVAGMIIGNHKKEILNFDMLESFWEVIDEILNATLFLLIGFELLTIHIAGPEYWAVLIAIPTVLLVRLITVAIPMKMFQLKRAHGPYTISILTWGGLRGALAVALALSLPPSHYRDFILAMTYGIVAFAIIIQGLTIKPLARLAHTK